jgi:hypothetical protein
MTITRRAGAGTVAGRVPSRFSTSSSTLGHPFVVEELRDEDRPEPRRSWSLPSFDAFVVATMLPFASVYEPLRSGLLSEGATLGAYVIMIGEEEEALLYSPDVVAIEPRRKTFRIATKPRLLPRRRPFIASSDLTTDD